MTEQPSAEPTTEKEWWDDPGMPWKHKPGKEDLWCMGWIGFLGIFSLAMLPLRGWLLGLNVPLLLGLTGSRTAAAGLGALVAVGQYTAWWWPMLFGTIMSIKFDWIYWWAGKLWGRGMIEIWAGQSERAARNYARVERWAAKWGAIGILIAYVPIPLPIMAVVFVLAGASGMSIKKFVIINAIASFLWSMLYFGFGYVIGEPAEYVLRQYARIANYVAIGLVIFVFVSMYLRSAAKSKADKLAAMSEPDPTIVPDDAVDVALDDITDAIDASAPADDPPPNP